MAQYSKLVITKQGQALVSSVFAQTNGGIEFSKICISSKQYSVSQLEDLESLDEIKQTSPISHIAVEGNSATVEAPFSNEELDNGYYMRTIGLYAVKPSGEEILYGVTAEQSGNCYMPKFSGKASSGAVIRLTATVGNAEVSPVVSRSAYATIEDIIRVQSELIAHNNNPNAHGSLKAEVDLLKMKLDNNITANAFEVTFENIDDLAVSGVYNTERHTIDF